MGKRGPRPKSAATRKLQGTAKRRQTAASKPRQPAAIADVPIIPAADVPSVKAIADDFIARAWPHVERAGLADDRQRHGFLLAAASYAVATRAAQLLYTSDQLTRPDENKVERKNPLLQILRDFTASYRSLATDYGLIPNGRDGVVPDDTAPRSEEERLELELFGNIIR